MSFAVSSSPKGSIVPGPFVEFEVMENQRNDEKERLNFLVEKFGITDLDIINCSYADLIRTIDRED